MSSSNELGGRINSSRQYHALIDASAKSFIGAMRTVLSAMKIEPLGDHGGYLEGVVYAQTRLRLYIMRIISDYERMYGLASSIILEHLLMDTKLRAAWEHDSSHYLITQLTSWSLNDGLPMEHNIFKEVCDRDNSIEEELGPLEGEDVEKTKKKHTSPSIPDESRRIGSVAGWLIRGDTDGVIVLPSATAVKHTVESGSTKPETTLNRAMHIWCNSPGVYWLMQHVIDLGFHKSLIYLENQLLFQLSPTQPIQQQAGQAQKPLNQAPALQQMQLNPQQIHQQHQVQMHQAQAQQQAKLLAQAQQAQMQGLTPQQQAQLHAQQVQAQQQAQIQGLQNQQQAQLAQHQAQQQAQLGQTQGQYQNPANTIYPPKRGRPPKTGPRMEQ